MKVLWNSFKAAFAMFSRIPVPHVDWEEGKLTYIMIFFPFVGALVGGVSFGIWNLMRYVFDYDEKLIAAVMILIPVMITGGIHLDGFLDTSDALGSHTDREKRLEIMKDSRSGAFAVINACTSFIVFYGAMTQIVLNRRKVIILCFCYFISRCISGFSVVSLPKASKDGTVAGFSRQANRNVTRTLLILFLFAAYGLLLRTHLVYSGVTTATALGVYLIFRHVALKYFGGVNGDLCGFYVCTSEVACALVLSLL